MTVHFNNDGGFNEAAWLSYKHGVLNPMSMASNIADKAADELQALGHNVKSITFDTGERQFTISYYDRGIPQEEHEEVNA